MAPPPKLHHRISLINVKFWNTGILSNEIKSKSGSSGVNYGESNELQRGLRVNIVAIHIRAALKWHIHDSQTPAIFAHVALSSLIHSYVQKKHRLHFRSLGKMSFRRKFSALQETLESEAVTCVCLRIIDLWHH